MNPICPVCGDDWPADDDECPGCGVYLTRTCDLCDRPIPATFGAALCHRCESTAKAHARLENDARRYPDPERRHAR